MATLTLLGRPSSGGHPAAAAADVLIGSNFKSHASAALTLEAAATQMLLKVNGATLLTLSGASTTTLTSAGTTQIDAPTGGAIAFTINGVGQLSVSGTGINAQAALSMSSNKITGLAQGSSSGEALCYPWITSVYGNSVLGSIFNITGSSGVYQDTGLSITLPSDGTYIIIADVRQQLNVTTGAGANIQLKFYNSTDSADIANSTRLGAYAGVVATTYQVTTTMHSVVSVNASKVINLYASRNTGISYNTSAIASDTAGYTQLFYVKINNT